MTQHDEPAGPLHCDSCGGIRKTYRAGEGGSVPAGTICCATCQYVIVKAPASERPTEQA